MSINETIPPSEVKLFKKAFQYEIYPNTEQQILLAKTFGCNRFIYNRLLVEVKNEYDLYLNSIILAKHNSAIIPLPRPSVNGFALINRVKQIKDNPEFSWLYEVSSQSLQQTASDLGNAFSKFFKRAAKYPNFKKKGSKQSFRLTCVGFNIDLETGNFKIAKSKDKVKIKYYRPLPSKPTRVTISKLPCGKYIATFICEYSTKKTNGTGTIGVDLGIKDFAIDSNGNKYQNPKYLVNALKSLKRKQQALSRKQKGSKNKAKAKLIVAKLHYHVAQQRSDYHQKLSRKLINENQVIVLESLKVKNMLKNRSLAKHIADAGWSSFNRLLRYKAVHSQHCNLVYIDTFFPSSKTCSCCGHVLEKLPLSVRRWACPVCLTVHDRDINAALNIKNEGTRQCGIHNPANSLKGYVIFAKH